MSTKEEDSYEITGQLKILIIGHSGTGKTSFVNRWAKNTFTEDYKATIVSEYTTKIVKCDGKFYKIHLWDLAGQDRSAKITHTFAKEAHGCIVMCDATDSETRKETLVWKKEVDDTEIFMDGKTLSMVLVENKVDLLENENEGIDELKDFGNQNGFCESIRSSAKNGKGVNEAMNFLIKNISDRLKELKNKDDLNSNRNSVALEPEKHKEIDKLREKESGCC